LVALSSTRRGQFAGAAARVANLYHRVMRVEVNTELCQGHNRCYALAPEIFDVDDYGTAVVIGDGTVSPELEEKAKLAVANCPEYAITITE
jgi:ferredoxin